MFSIGEDICHVAEERAKRERNAQKNAKEGSLDGKTVTVEVYTSSRTDLSEFREPYYRDKSKTDEEIRASWRKRPREHPPGWTPDDE